MNRNLVGLVAALWALLLGTGCGAGAGGGAPSTGDGGAGATENEGGGAASGGPAAAACDAYTRAVLACIHPTVPLPASEMARLQPRWEASCAADLAMPGSGTTESWLEGCTAAIQAKGCELVTQPGGACAPPTGTLGASSACIYGTQCGSGICQGTSTTSACGTCTAPSAIGQPCPDGLGCSWPAACDEAMDSTTQVCMAVTYGAAGSDCDPLAYQCAPGLVCLSTSGLCGSPGAAGAPCTTATDCQPPLGCPTLQGQSTCRAPGQAGAACALDTDCVAGLGCDADAFMCTAVTWASAGETCGGGTRCLVGACPFANGKAGGTCPAITPDGQPCSPGTRCDMFAECLGGTCQLTPQDTCP